MKYKGRLAGQVAVSQPAGRPGRGGRGGLEASVQGRACPVVLTVSVCLSVCSRIAGETPGPPPWVQLRVTQSHCQALVSVHLLLSQENLAFFRGAEPPPTTGVWGGAEGRAHVAVRSAKSSWVAVWVPSALPLKALSSELPGHRTGHPRRRSADEGHVQWPPGPGLPRLCRSDPGRPPRVH